MAGHIPCDYLVHWNLQEADLRIHLAVGVAAAEIFPGRDMMAVNLLRAMNEINEKNVFCLALNKLEILR